MTEPPPAGARLDGRAARAVYAAFILIGTCNVILGPLIPRLHARQGVPLETLGVLFPIQFVAQGVGAVLSSRNVRRSLWLGYGFISVGLAAVAFGWPAATVGIALTGVGLGLAIPASNLLAAQAHPGRRAAAISQLNVLWGLGALGVPLLFTVLRDTIAPAALAGATALVAIAFALMLPALSSPAAPGEGRRPAGGPPWAFVILTAELFLYTGAEATAGGWVIALAGERHTAAGAGSNYVGSAFWGALLFGRVVAPAVIGAVSERTLHRFCLALSGAGCVAILIARSPWGTAAGALVVGLGMAPLFPLIAARLVAFTERHRSRASGTVFAVGGVGAGALPWIAGIAAAKSGGLWVAFLVPLAALAAMGGLLAVGRRLGLGEDTATPSPENSLGV